MGVHFCIYISSVHFYTNIFGHKLNPFCSFIALSKIVLSETQLQLIADKYNCAQVGTTTQEDVKKALCVFYLKRHCIEQQSHKEGRRGTFMCGCSGIVRFFPGPSGAQPVAAAMLICCNLPPNVSSWRNPMAHLRSIDQRKKNFSFKSICTT